MNSVPHNSCKFNTFIQVGYFFTLLTNKKKLNAKKIKIVISITFSHDNTLLETESVDANMRLAKKEANRKIVSLLKVQR